MLEVKDEAVIKLVNCDFESWDSGSRLVTDETFDTAHLWIIFVYIYSFIKLTHVQGIRHIVLQVLWLICSILMPFSFWSHR